ncbi:MAG: Fis family transcriptional regulator [Desulfuromonas sp.]|nr:MAG: Fis family transcriptional regulator [Desulfuromonas sp.]
MNRSPCEIPAAEELNRELMAIINSSSDGLFVCRADGTVIRVNPASERLHGIRAEEIIGRNIEELVEEGFVERSATLDAIRTGQPVSVLQHHDGRKLLSTGNPVFDDRGQLVLAVTTVRDVTEMDRMQRELEEQGVRNSQFREQMLTLQQEQLVAKQVIARSPEMLTVLGQAIRVGGAESTVLILGESGSGKGLLVDLIHSNSRRSKGPLIKLNCGAIPDTLIESELFGYEKGAFTGADGSKPGYFEMADGGTLFLDEVAELPPPSQVKLLRFLEDGNIARLGGTTSRKVDVRILAATHRDLSQMVEEGGFRLDLYYRLNVIPMQVPPLRERRECILPLLRHYIDFFAEKSGVHRRLSRAAVDTLIDYPYPGNVRELMNLCERLVVMSETEMIGLVDLPPSILQQTDAQHLVPVHWQEGDGLQEIVAEVEREVLSAAKERFASQAEIAQALGVNQSTIARKLRRYSL